jgi:subtilase family serine protease
MLAPVGGVGPSDIRSLYALQLHALQRLAVLQVEQRIAGLTARNSIGIDQYIPSVATAAPTLTYNRFGRLDGASTSSQPDGLTPAQVAQAYGFNSTHLTGAGQTIAIITAYNSPTIAQDLAVFDRTFGLPDPTLQVVNSQGGTPSGPTDAGWAVETALDVEWAHAIAPQATILVVEGSAATVTDLATAIDYARHQPGVSVISMSFGTTEFPQELSYNSLLTAPPGHTGITFVASSGDSGAGTLWPAVSPNVLSVGGTQLLTNPSGGYFGEVAWPGSGGGVSLYQMEPVYQLAVQHTGRRTTPDVAYAASPSPGFAIYEDGSWGTVGGTSASAPQWSGLIALTDQQRALHGLGPINQAQTQLYNLPATDFHDIVLGSNGYLAGVGYDFVTGLGSPVANRLISDLANPWTITTPHLPLNLHPVSIVSLLFPWHWTLPPAI